MNDMRAPRFLHPGQHHRRTCRRRARRRSVAQRASGRRCDALRTRGARAPRPGGGAVPADVSPALHRREVRTGRHRRDQGRVPRHGRRRRATDVGPDRAQLRDRDVELRGAAQGRVSQPRHGTAPALEGTDGHRGGRLPERRRRNHRGVRRHLPRLARDTHADHGRGRIRVQGARRRLRGGTLLPRPQHAHRRHRPRRPRAVEGGAAEPAPPRRDASGSASRPRTSGATLPIAPSARLRFEPSRPVDGLPAEFDYRCSGGSRSHSTA